MRKSGLNTKKIFIFFIVLSLTTLVLFLKLNINSEQKNPEVLRIKDKQYFLTFTGDSLQILDNKQNVIDSICLITSTEKIISYCVADLNKDNTDEILVITGLKESEFGQDFFVYTYNNALQKIYYKSFKEMNPWKVQTSDVDGDGNLEIAIAMYKKTRFHPVMAKRPYLYDWIDNSVFPKWRGSRLSKPFDDYIFQDIDKDGSDELISIEVLSNGKKVICSYKWIGFGFEGLVQSNNYDDILKIKKTNQDINQINVHIQEGSKNKWISLKYDGNVFLEQAIVQAE